MLTLKNLSARVILAVICPLTAWAQNAPSSFIVDSVDGEEVTYAELKESYSSNGLREMEAKSFSNKFDYNNRRGVFWLEGKLEARKMTFDEAFPLLLNEYQPQREQE